MDIVGLEPRKSDLARGILIARSTRNLDAKEQDALIAALTQAGVSERTEEETDSHADDPDRRIVAAPWLPPDASELEAQKQALLAAAAIFELETVWFVKVETGADGIAWLDLEAESREELRQSLADDDDDDVVDDGDDDEDDDEDLTDPLGDAIQAPVHTPTEEVLYAAPDAPPEPEPTLDEDDPDDDDDELDGDLELDGLQLESHWRNGAPPFESSVAFPIERYPEIIDEYDWESFGIALKLAGTPIAGEESVINAFFALWLSVYQDERTEEFEPFQRADVIHDRKHRSALMWVEQFAVPATASDQVHFLLWIAARINDIVPIAWARFDTVDDTVKQHASADDDGVPFVLAGNPFADRFRRQGEEAALSWAVSQSAWSRRELAGMLVEVALEHDPDDPEAAKVAERLLRRAISFDAESDAVGYLAIVLVRQDRVPEAIALAATTTAENRDVRLLVIGEVAEHVSEQTDAALDLLDPETAAATPPEDLAELVAAIARHAPQWLSKILDLMPETAALVPHLYNASFSVDRPEALKILRRVITLPEPAKGTGEARTALVMAWNNACIHAHALGHYELAVELADGGQKFAAENPYIYHSAACAYAASGQIDRAIAQVALAIEHDYEHSERMETDPDLAALASDPRFAALFVDWRAKRADLN